MLVAISSVAGYFLSTVLPKKYEAKVTVRNAYIGNLSSQSQSQPQSVLVEANTQTIARLTSPKFYTTTILSACDASGDNEAEILSKAIKAIPVKSTLDLTALSFTGKSREQANSCLHSVLQHLTQTQLDMVIGKQKYLQNLLDTQRVSLAEMQKYEKELNNAILKNGVHHNSPAESALSLYGIQSKQNLIQEARKGVLELESLLQPPSTQKLTPLEPIYVSSKPVSPNPWLFSFAGLLLGLFACALVCWREILALLNSDE